MKRCVCFVCVFFLLLYCGSIVCATAESKSKEEVEREIGAEIEKYIDSLDLDEFEKYLHTLESSEEMRGGVKGLISGFVKSRMT